MYVCLYIKFMSTIIAFWVFEGKADEGAVHGMSCMISKYLGGCDKKKLVQSQTKMHGKFNASLNCIVRLCLKVKKKK